MARDNTTESFSDKILGIRNYESDKDLFYSTDFTNSEILLDFLTEVYDGESDITPAGTVFLKQHMNLRELAENARKDGIALPPYGRGKTDEERIGHFLSFIETIQPMEISLFIAEAEWDSSKDGDKPTLDNLDEKLLPPKS
jgi:hypothetical protein